MWVEVETDVDTEVNPEQKYCSVVVVVVVVSRRGQTDDSPAMDNAIEQGWRCQCLLETDVAGHEMTIGGSANRVNLGCTAKIAKYTIFQREPSETKVRLKRGEIRQEELMSMLIDRPTRCRIGKVHQPRLPVESVDVRRLPRIWPSGSLTEGPSDKPTA